MCKLYYTNYCYCSWLIIIYFRNIITIICSLLTDASGGCRQVEIISLLYLADILFALVVCAMSAQILCYQNVSQIQCSPHCYILSVWFNIYCFLNITENRYFTFGGYFFFFRFKCKGSYFGDDNADDIDTNIGGNVALGDYGTRATYINPGFVDTINSDSHHNWWFI